MRVASAHDTEELFAHEVVNCADGRRVITFNNNDARDNFREIAEAAGEAYEAGNGYLVEAPDTAASESATTEPTYPAPATSDFGLKVNTLSKDCFDSDCTFTVQVELNCAVGVTKLRPGKTYELFYLIHGGKEPVSGSFTLTGGSDEYQVDEEVIVTSSRNTKLTADVIGIQEV